MKEKLKIIAETSKRLDFFFIPAHEVASVQAVRVFLRRHSENRNVRFEVKYNELKGVITIGVLRKGERSRKVMPKIKKDGRRFKTMAEYIKFKQHKK